MKKTVIALSLAAMTLPAIAQKAAEPEFSVSGNFGLFSDYRFRGISQTDLAPALQGGFDFSHKSGFYLGTWASNVSEFANVAGNGMEIDFYGGYKFPVGDFTFDIGNLYYYYPGSEPFDKKPNTNEIYVGISYGAYTLKTSYATSEYFGVNDTKGSMYYDLSASYPLSEGLTLSAHVGYLDGKDAQLSNTDYKLGISKDVGGYLLGLTYIGNDGDLADSVKSTDIGDGKTKDMGKGGLVLSISKTF
jgi:uncharacterized protein (TIGR02001 family)